MPFQRLIPYSNLDLLTSPKYNYLLRQKINASEALNSSSEGWLKHFPDLCSWQPSIFHKQVPKHLVFLSSCAWALSKLAVKYRYLCHSCMKAVTGNGIWVQGFFAVTAYEVKVIGPKRPWQQSFPGWNQERLLKEFGDLFVTDQQNYKALHRSLSTPPIKSPNQGNRNLSQITIPQNEVTPGLTIISSYTTSSSYFLQKTESAWSAR